MGMFPAPRSGDAFVDSFIGMGNFITGMNKANDDRAQRVVDNERNAAADERAQQSLEMQKTTAASTNAYHDVSTVKLKREEEQAGLLGQAAEAAARIKTGVIDPADVKTIAASRVANPDLQNNVENHDTELSNMNSLTNGFKFINQMPPSKTPYSLEYGQLPVGDEFLDAVNSITPSSRHDTEHTDTSGKVTGEAGKKYYTDKIGGAIALSNEGSGNVAFRLTVKDEDGNPIYEKDANGLTVFKKNDDGTVAKDATGAPIPQPKLVASSVGHTNNPNSMVKLIPNDLSLLRMSLNEQQIAAEKQIMATPEGRQQLETAVADAAKTKEKQLKELEIMRAKADPKGYLAKIDDAAKPHLKTVAADAVLVDERNPSKIVLANPKAKDVVAPVQHSYKKNGFEVTERWNPLTKSYEEIGRNKIKEPTDPNSVVTAQERLRSRRDVAVRLRDAARAHQAALKIGDSDQINDSIGLIESLNADAKEYGVPPFPVPPRPFTRDEETAIYNQALKNINEKRSGIPKFFGTKPNKIAIAQEAFRLKKTVKPGAVNFGNADAGQSASQTAQTAQAPAVQQQPASAMHAVPPAAQHSGRIVKDTVTGKRYQSNGSAWVEVR